MNCQGPVGTFAVLGLAEPSGSVSHGMAWTVAAGAPTGFEA